MNRKVGLWHKKWRWRHLRRELGRWVISRKGRHQKPKRKWQWEDEVYIDR